MFERQEPIESKRRFKFESYIGRNSSWWDYYRHYKNAIDELVNGIEQNTIQIDNVSLSLLFLIRHCLELGLKANILKLEEINDSVAKIKLSGNKSHSIEVLYNKFIEHLNTVKKNFRINN